MTNEEISELRKEIFNKIESMMEFKGKEYSRDRDRLANFKRNGVNLNLPPEVIWSVYAGKHWDSIISFTSNLKNSNINNLEKYLSEPIDGRITDLITYLILLQGLIIERRQLENT